MNAWDWLALAGVCAAGAVSPGPSLALVVRHAVDSPAAGLRCALAHALGVGCYAALAVTGVALVLAESALLGRTVAVLGGIWLLGLALRLWRSSAAWSPAAVSTNQALRDGLLMALVNPKVMLFFVAVFARFLPAGASPAEHAGIVLLVMLVDGGWYALVSLLLQRPGLLERLRRQAGLINRGSALILAGLAFSLWWGVLQ